MYLMTGIVALYLYGTVHAIDTFACFGSFLRIQCDESKGETIQIIGATYGRTNPHRCIHPLMSNVTCNASDTFEKVSSRCNLRTECKMVVSNFLFGDPCEGVNKYLEVQHRCVQSDRKRAVSCEGSNLRIDCGTEKTIRIHSANYGRGEAFVCEHLLSSNSNCGGPNDLEIVSARCSSQTKCNVPAENSVFGNPPCFRTFKYLEVNYSCIQPDGVADPDPPSTSCGPSADYLDVPGMTDWCNNNCPEYCPTSHCNDACRP